MNAKKTKDYLYLCQCGWNTLRRWDIGIKKSCPRCSSPVGMNQRTMLQRGLMRVSFLVGNVGSLLESWGAPGFLLDIISNLVWVLWSKSLPFKSYKID